MDFNLGGRAALLVGLEPAIAAACAEVLMAEGAKVLGYPPPDAAGGPHDGSVDADIVVASSPSRPGSSILEQSDPVELRKAWGAVADAVAVYRRALPGMTERGWGRFVWIGTAQAKSLDADHDQLGAVVSLGMMGLHKVIASEEGAHGLTANAVLRGGDATEHDVANTVVFFCSEGAGYLNGVTVSVDGGAGSAVF
jgi:NAD(P)-dependent dehydrogenase (short-subunit alcohol dehydrogenase family)